MYYHKCIIINVFIWRKKKRILALLILSFFIFTTRSKTGMQFFSNRLRFDKDGIVIDTIGSTAWINAASRPRHNFDDFSHSFATVIIVQIAIIYCFCISYCFYFIVAKSFCYLFLLLFIVVKKSIIEAIITMTRYFKSPHWITGTRCCIVWAGQRDRESLFVNNT